MSDVFRQATEAKAQRHDALVRALLGVETESEAQPEELKTPSFDGGVRQSPPLPPPSHGETLVEIIRSRSADIGARWLQ